MVKKTLTLMIACFITMLHMACEDGGDSSRARNSALALLFLSSPTPAVTVDGSSVASFNVVNAYDDETRFDILYNKSYSGEMKYIISATDLGIATESQFNACGQTPVTVAISGNDLLYNNYIKTASLSYGTEYHVYILYNHAITSFVKTVQANNDPEMITGTAAGTSGAGTRPYEIIFPNGYDASSSKKWPLLVSLGANSVSFSRKSNFPCILFNSSIVNGGTRSGDINAIKDTLKTVISTYNIDTGKLYLTGFSTGGCAAVEIANNDGSGDYQFKAMIPVSIASYLQSYCANLGDINIWLFYGESGDSCADATRLIYTKIPEGNGEHLLTGMPGAGHTSGPVYASPYTFLWLFGK